MQMCLTKTSQPIFHYNATLLGRRTQLNLELNLEKLRTGQQLVLVFRSHEKSTVTIVFNFNLTVKQVTGSGNMREIEKHTR